LSTSSQPNLTPSWKQEVNRRLEAHKNRKGSSAEQGKPLQAHGTVSSRAAQAAARVAARYAKAPSYSQMQAAEAQMAVRAAEIATQVALEAQAAAETVLAELHAATVEPPARGPAVIQTFALPVPRAEDPARKVAPAPKGGSRAEASGKTPAQLFSTETTEAPTARSEEQVHASPVGSVADDLFSVDDAQESRSFGIRWDPDMPTRPIELKPAQPREREELDLTVEDWWTPGEVSATLRNEPIEIAGPQSAHANLIHFPRELVATRKIRPRLAEAPSGPDSEREGQLSIFEVDPAAVATEIAPEEAMSPLPTPTWSGPEWSGIELEAQPWEESGMEADPAPPTGGPQLAPLGWRLMAAAADAGMIAGAFILVAFAAAINMHDLPAGKPLVLAMAAVLLTTWLGYHAFFFSVAKSTPGMKYAGIELCTFAGSDPTRAQLRARLGGMVLSLLPVGLGVVWALFDEDHLSWHDRISGTYLRKR
jgi:uncharacterized RDD family membrane protein YckC